MGKYRHGEDQHHRVPRSRGGTGEARNLSRVCTMRHRAFHYLFKNWLPEQIAEELNRKWIDPDKKFIVVPREADEKRCRECGRVIQTDICDTCDFWKGDGLA